MCILTWRKQDFLTFFYRKSKVYSAGLLSLTGGISPCILLHTIALARCIFDCSLNIWAQQSNIKGGWKWNPNYVEHLIWQIKGKSGHTRKFYLTNSKELSTKFCHWPDWKENFWNFDYCQIKYWPKKVSHKLLNLKIALLLFPQSTHETRAIKFCDRMLLHIATNSVIPGSHIRNLQNMPLWYYATEIREVLSLHGFFLLKTRVFVGYSIYIFEIPIGLLIVLCKWYVDYKSSSCETSRHSSQVVVGHLNLLWAVAAFLQH